MNEPSFPDPSILASVQHEAEKLGHLVAQIEANFGERAMYERRQILKTHAEQGAELIKAWLDGDINLYEYSEKSAALAEETSDALDAVKLNFTFNVDQLNHIIQHHVAAGRSQESELDDFLNDLLSDE